MIRIENITSKHEQRQTIEFERGSVELTLKFHNTTENWFMDILFTRNDGSEEELKLFGSGVAIGSFLLKHKNWPFGFVCKDISNAGIDPYKEDDFSSGRCELHFLTPDDMRAIRGGIMSDRFRRAYELTIGIAEKAVMITPPMDISFECTESTLGTPNTLRLQIKGLTKETANKLLKKEADKTKHFPISLKAGYEGNINQIYQGSILKTAIAREGAILVVTVESKDGIKDIQHAVTAKTIENPAETVDAIIADMPNTKKGAVSPDIKTTRPRVVMGYSADELKKLAGKKKFYIKDEMVHILGDDEVERKFIPTVNSATGLKNVPQQTNQETTFETLLNPALRIGCLCDLKSGITPSVNGIYKIRQLITKGDYKGDWSQSVTCEPKRNQAFKEVPK